MLALCVVYKKGNLLVEKDIRVKFRYSERGVVV